jgi:hypothetical protein
VVFIVIELLTRINQPKEEELAGGWRKYFIKSFIIFTFHLILLG